MPWSLLGCLAAIALIGVALVVVWRIKMRDFRMISEALSTARYELRASPKSLTYTPIGAKKMMPVDYDPEDGILDTGAFRFIYEDIALVLAAEKMTSYLEITLGDNIIGIQFIGNGVGTIYINEKIVEDSEIIMQRLIADMKIVHLKLREKLKLPEATEAV